MSAKNTLLSLFLCSRPRPGIPLFLYATFRNYVQPFLQRVVRVGTRLGGAFDAIVLQHPYRSASKIHDSETPRCRLDATQSVMREKSPGERQ